MHSTYFWLLYQKQIEITITMNFYKYTKHVQPQSEPLGLWLSATGKAT